MSDEPHRREVGTGARDASRDLWDDDSMTTPTLDVVFEILSHRRRRLVLYHLAQVPGGVEQFDALVDQVAAWETDANGGDVPENHRSRVATDLHHVHLPKLADANVLDYDDRSETIRYWGQPTVEEYAEHAAVSELPDCYRE